LIFYGYPNLRIFDLLRSQAGGFQQRLDL